MRHERPGGCSARKGLKHRSLDFQEVQGIEEVAQVADDSSARAEHIAARLAENEIEVALPIARHSVAGSRSGQVLRQAPRRLHDHAQVVDADCEFAAPIAP